MPLLHCFVLALIATTSGAAAADSSSIPTPPLAERLFAWVLTDAHVDSTYSEGADTSRNCQSGTRGNSSAFGSYTCDTPPTMLDAALEAMVAVKPDVDYFIWLGDLVPYVEGDDDT